MSGTTTETAYQPEQRDAFDWDAYYEHVVTEDDEPVDSLFAEKQQRLLAEPLYASWTPPAQPQQPTAQPRIFLAAANVGIFYDPGQRPIVPDFFLSLDVKPHPRWHEKRYRSYFLREFGKPPEVSVEIVSDEAGSELSAKLEIYARVGVRYYVVFDPFGHLSNEVLQLFELDAGVYRRRDDLTLSEVGLRLVLWEGIFEGLSDMWLRWCDAQGNLLLTGHERATTEATARHQAEDRAAQAEEHAARLAAKLRELGVEPEEL
jgi:Uma2 family endonuclease